MQHVAQFVQIGDSNGIGRTQGPMIRAITSLAAELGLLVVGEGVETTEELKRLVEYECQLAQGFVFEGALEGSTFTCSRFKGLPVGSATIWGRIPLMPEIACFQCSSVSCSRFLAAS